MKVPLRERNMRNSSNNDLGKQGLAIAVKRAVERAEAHRRFALVVSAAVEMGMQDVDELRGILGSEEFSQFRDYGVSLAAYLEAHVTIWFWYKAKDGRRLSSDMQHLDAFLQKARST